MLCYVCSKDEWKKVIVNLDGKERPIHSEGTVQICKNCGNACHEVDSKQEEKVKEYYRKDYRPAPNISNLITTTHKMRYIDIFLRDFLEEATKANKRMKIADVGCATGYLLGYFKRMGHLATGCEYTIPYRRMAEHYYGVPVSEELETKHRYDLIVIYHVLEHMIEPDKKLAHYASLLAEGGRMMIATPEWFKTLEEDSGGPMEGFDHLYHKNHINLFSRQSLQNLFRKAGLFVVKEDYEQYGQTYLLRKAKDGEIIKDWLVKENWVDVEREMLRDFKAIHLYLSGRLKEALDVKKNFPEAWMALIGGASAKDPGRQATLFAEANAALGDNKRYKIFKGRWHYQRNEFAEALGLFREATEVCPNEDIFMFMGYAHAQLGDRVQAIQYFEQAQAMDPRKWQEAQSWILKIICDTPAWDERAMAQAKEILFKNALQEGQIKVEMKDPFAEKVASGNGVA